MAAPSPTPTKAARMVTPNHDDTAVLKLIPIDEAACLSYLRNRRVSPPTINESITSHRPIVLKLSPVRNLVDVRSSSFSSTISQNTSSDNMNKNMSVVYAKQFSDGNIAASVVLGRNKHTKIRLNGVSRALCEINFSRVEGNRGTSADAGELNVAHAAAGSNNDENNINNNKQTLAAHLMMRRPPGKHLLCVNGCVVSEPVGRSISIQDGSIISLLGQSKFAYLVKFLEVDDTIDSMPLNGTDENSKPSNESTVASAATTSSISTELESQRISQPVKSEEQSPCPEHKSPTITATTTTSSPTPHHLLRKRSHQLMIGEQTCALCMDILIKSTFAYPCGHAFCHSCTSSCNNTCPNCRGKVEGWMPARSYDTIIWATALQGCFEKEDAKAYLERRRECGEDEPTEVERECILGNGGGDDHDGKGGGKNGYYVPSPIKNGVPTVAAMPPLYSNGNGMAPLGNRLTYDVNTANSLDMKGSSVDDPICLD